MTDRPVHTATALELIGAYRAGALTPVETAQALLDRIGEVDGTLNAFCLLDVEETLRQAEASAERHRTGAPLGLLDGVPVAVKDTFRTQGWPTRFGSQLVDPDQPWLDDAPAVARLREAGAVLIGKTTTPEFGWKGVTDSPLTGVTRNPWNPATTPGGSSGGSAAALAAGLAPLALGTDGGGSIRIPGAFSGVVGLKPTFGRVPHAPMSPFGTLSHAGPMARTVADAHLLFEVMAVHDPSDWTALPTAPVAPLGDADLTGRRVMFSLTLGFAEVDPEVATLVTRAAEVIESLGASVEAADPEIADPTVPWETLWNAAAAAVVDRLDADRLHLVDPGLVEIAAAGRELSALRYVNAFQHRVDVAARLAATLARYDLLLTPTMPIPAFEAAMEVPPGWPHRRWQSWSPFTLPFNLSGQPAMTVPCGVTSFGLPVGLQIVAATHHDDLVWAAAHAYEQARSRGDDQFMRPRPDPTAS